VPFGEDPEALLSEPPSDMDEGSGYSDDESAALAEAFPEMGGSPERMAAFKAAVSMCVDRILTERGEGSEGGSGPKSEPPMMGGKGGKAKADGALLLAFGKPSKKP
jgi:hypothetical protein